MITVFFSYADKRVEGYEQFGAARDLRKDGFAILEDAWEFVYEVERRAKRNRAIVLDHLEIASDEEALYECDYNRKEFMWLYVHVDCQRGTFRYVK